VERGIAVGDLQTELIESQVALLLVGAMALLAMVFEEAGEDFGVEQDGAGFRVRAGSCREQKCDQRDERRDGG